MRLNDIPIPGRTVPFLGDFSRGADAPALQTLVNAHARLGRIAALSPAAPPSLLSLWRERFGLLVADPVFLAEAARRGYAIEATGGKAVAAMIDAVLGEGTGFTAEALRRALAT